MMKPVVYLDVDGVLNAFELYRSDPPRDCFDDFSVVPVDHSGGGTYLLTLSRQMGAALAEAFREVEVLWLTTWKADAPGKIASHIGLPDWHWLDYEGDGKFDAIVGDQVASPRPFVWIDDFELADARREHVVDRLEEALAVVGGPPPHLLVAPDPGTGLRPSQIARIDEWLATFSGRDEA